MNIIFPSFALKVIDREKENFQDFLSKTFFSFVGGLGKKLRTLILIPSVSFMSQSEKALGANARESVQLLICFLLSPYFLFSSLHPLQNLELRWSGSAVIHFPRKVLLARNRLHDHTSCEERYRYVWFND